MAQTYPSRTATVVVPFRRAARSMALPRILVQKLNQIPGWNFIVENRVGAGGTLGTNSVAKACAGWPHAAVDRFPSTPSTPFLFKNLPYDFVKDLTPSRCSRSGRCW